MAATSTRPGVLARASPPADMPRDGLKYEHEALARVHKAFEAIFGSNRDVEVQAVAAAVRRGMEQPVSSALDLLPLSCAVGLALKGHPASASRVGRGLRAVADFEIDARRFVRTGGGKKPRKVALLTTSDSFPLIAKEGKANDHPR